MRLLGLLGQTFFFLFFQKRTAILKAFEDGDFHRLGGSSSLTSEIPLSYNFFEQS